MSSERSERDEPTPDDEDARRTLEALAARRWKIALTLTAVMLAVYFGFIFLVAYAKSVMSVVLTPGLSMGILLGALVIVTAWIVTGIYVRWANVHYDSELDALRATIKKTKDDAKDAKEKTSGG